MAAFSKEKRLKLAEERGIIVDECDKHLLEEYTWCIGNHGYAVSSYKTSEGNRYALLHRKIMGEVPDHLVVDHINRDKLDNRRSNLRIVSQSDNMKNSKTATIISAKYVGKFDHFRAEINVGTFEEEEEAMEELNSILKILRAANYMFPHERRYAAQP